MLTSDVDGSPNLYQDASPRLNVTAMVVARHGGEPLAATLDALIAAHRRPDRLVLIDTTPDRSTHQRVDTHRGLRDAFPDLSVITAPAGASFADTVDIAVEALPAPGEDVVVAKRSRTRADKRPIRPRDRYEWFWLLHEENRPDPGALHALVETVEGSSRIGVAGCKVRDAQHPRRLLNVGLDVTRTGRHVGERMRVEFDQGQHDSRSDVLAVSSSGLLVRRDVYATLGGFDPAFDGDGDGLDLCWRAHLTGHQVVVVPEAVVHQRTDLSSDRGQGTGTGNRSDPDLPAPRSARTLRRHRQVALARSSLLGWPVMSLWVFVSGIVLGFAMLLVKRPRRALAEFAQASAPLALPRIIGARARFFGRASARRRYLAPLFVSAGAALSNARDSLRAAVTLQEPGAPPALVDEGAGETGPVQDDAQALAPAPRPLGRLVGPGLWAVLALLVAAGLQWRELLGSRSFQGRSGSLAGGELRPFVTDSGGIWRLYRDAWTGAGIGGPNSHSEYLLALWPVAWLLEHIPGLAHASSGHTAVVWLLALTMPLSALTAYRAGRVLTPHAWPRAVVAALWAASALATTASAQARLGPAVGQVVAPLVFAGLVAVARRRASATMTFATIAIAAVLGAFVPILLAFATLGALLVAVLGSGWARLRGLLVAVTPWALLGAQTRRLIDDPRTIFAGPGNLVTGPAPDVAGWQLALLHPGGPGSYPVLFGLPLLVLALLGLLGPGRHRLMLGASVLGLAGLALALLAPRLTVMQTADGPRTLWAGIPLQMFALACAATALAGLAAPHPRTRTAKALLHPVSAVLAAAVAAGVVGIAGWAGQVQSLQPVSKPLPEMVRKQFSGPRSVRALVLTVHRDGGLSYRVQGREAGLPVTDLALPAPSGGPAMATAVGDLLRGQGESAALALHRLAIGYVVVTGPGAGNSEITGALQSGGSLLRMNAPATNDVWRVAPQPAAGGSRTIASSRLVLQSADQPVNELASSDWHAAASVSMPASSAPRRVVVAEPAGWARTAQVRYAGRSLTPATRNGELSYALPHTAGRLVIQQRPTYQRTRTAQLGLWLIVVFIALPLGNRASRRRAW